MVVGVAVVAVAAHASTTRALARKATINQISGKTPVLEHLECSAMTLTDSGEGEMKVDLREL